MTPPVVACLGKIPSHGDFVRLNHGQVPEILVLDRWLLEGMERAYGARGRSFEESLRNLPAVQFLMQAGGSPRLLAGVMVPSADKVGRVYPLVVAFSLDAPAPGPGYDRLPVAIAPGLQSALAVARGEHRNASLQEFLQQVQDLTLSIDDNAAEQALRSFLFGTLQDSLWSGWPGFQSSERRARCLQELHQMTRPPFPPRFVTAIPMSGAPAEVSFWLTLLRQWLPVRANPSLVLWPAADSGTGPLRLLLDDLNARYFEPVLWPDRESDYRLDLGRGVVRQQVLAADATAAMLKPRGLLQDLILAAARA